MTDALRIQTFSDNLEMLSQQMGAKLAPFCRTETATPGQKSHRMLSQIEKSTVSERTNRAETIDNSTVSYDGRWVYWKRYHQDTIVDDIDIKQTNITPEGMIARSFVAAMNRQQDTDFTTAFFGTAKTDETGGTSTVFDTNNVVAVTEGVGSATGLNVAKLRAAKKILLENDVDLDFETPYLAIAPKQHDDLLALTQVVSTDFNDRPILGQDGMVRRFLGMNIIISTLLPADSNSYRRNPVWVPSGMGRAMWKELSGDMRRLPNYKGNPTLIEAEMQLGFTRLEEAKCVEIKSSEA